MIELKPGQHIHMLGICGTAMASLAGLLKSRGFKVTGSDTSFYPPMSEQLEKLNIPTYKGYKLENLKVRPDFVVIGNVISAQNEEAQEVIRLGIPYTSLPKAMGEFIIQDRECVCISGTHGKTTTTSLVSWIFEVLGHKPGFMIGGIPKNFERSFQNPQGKYFVIEGDEYDTAFFDKVPKFIHYKPLHVILTSVEFDHADIYTDLDAVKAAFARLMKMIPRHGNLVAWAEDPQIADLKTLTNTPNVFTYGFNKGEYRCDLISENPEGSTFQVTFDGKGLGPFRWSLSGQYNILNATAAIALCHRLGFPMEGVQKALSTFAGVKRRQEIRGEPHGVLVIEDFAHHPTAVRETLKGLKARYPQRNLWAVFEPRSATSRRKIFQKDYVDAFLNAQQVLIAEAFDQSKIEESNRFSSQELVDDLKKKKRPAQVFANADAIVQDITNRSQTGDLVVIMSNGGFDDIYNKLLQSLEKRGARP